MITKKQVVGLITNGIDPISDRQPFRPLLPRKGRNHLMRPLDILARVEYTQKRQFTNLLDSAIVHLTWGTTLLIITGHADEAVFDILFKLRQAGFTIVLILVGYTADVTAARARGHQFGFPVFQFRNETDMNIWRQ